MKPKLQWHLPALVAVAGASVYLLAGCGSNSGTGNPPSAPQIATTSLPSGQVATPYQTTLAATGGTTPYSWSIASGTLPPGLTLAASSGQISGTPSLAGTFSFTAKVTDSTSKSAQQSLSISISGAGTPPVAITTTSLPQGQVSQPYLATLQATGGTTPYSWSVTGALPPGLSLNASTGQITGTPTQSGTFGFTAQVRDSSNQTASATLSITIAASPPTTAAIAVDASVTHQTFLAWRTDLPFTKLEGTTPPCAAVTTAMRDGVVAAFVDMGISGERLGWGASSPGGIEDSANDNNDPLAINMAGFQPSIEATQGACGDSVPARMDLWTIPLRQAVMANGEHFETYVSLDGDVRDISAMYSWWVADVNEATEGFEALFRWWFKRYGFYPEFYAFNEPGSGSCVAIGGVNICYFNAPVHWMFNFNAAAATRLAVNLGTTALGETPNTVSAGDCLNGACAEIANNPWGVGRFAYHGYGNPTAAQLNQIRSYAQTASTITGRTIPTAMGEICCSPGSVMWDGSYANGKDALRFMHLHMSQADAAVYEDLDNFSVCASAGCPDGLNNGGALVHYDPSVTDYFLLPRYWVSRQWMKYIRRGYVRVDASSSNSTVYSLAWKRPNNTLVVNILNDTGSPQAITLTGIPNGTYNLFQLDPTMCVTTGRNRCMPQTTQLAAGSGVTLSLPTDAAWTVVQQ